MRDPRPNLLLIFADQLRAAALGCYGQVDAHTPHLDRFALQGVRASRCIANYPVCGPMRACMVSGTHPVRHGVVANDLAIDTRLPSYGSLLRDAGYRTGWIGKWHLDGVPRSRFTPPGPRRMGFDDDWFAFNCAHNYFNSYYFHDTPRRIETEGYEPTVQTDLALRLLREYAEDERPFALTLSWGPPHDPYPQVPPAFRDRFDPADVSLRPNCQPGADNPLATRWNLDCRRTLADYQAAVCALDVEFGRVLAELEELGLDRDTHVIFTSDHGDMLWSHGWMKKQSPFTESVHVPLLVRGPGLPCGETFEGLFGLVDLAPTMLGLCGVLASESMQGLDLSGGLRNPASPGKQAAVLIANPFSSDEAADQAMPEWRGLRTDRHTYVEQTPDIPWLLFDDRDDPYQLHNLADDPGHSYLCAVLSRRLQDELKGVGDPFLPGPVWLEQLGLTAAWDDRNQRLYDKETTA